jgi:preprotein translocase subunit SecG
MACKALCIFNISLVLFCNFLTFEFCFSSMFVPLLYNFLYLYLFVLLQQSSGHSWLGSQGSSSGLVVKKTIKVDIPVDKYPTVSSIMFFVLYHMVTKAILPTHRSACYRGVCLPKQAAFCLPIIFDWMAWVK